MIRMKPEDAMRAGLLDPLVAEQLGFGGALKKKPKKKNPKPAASLVGEGEIPGSGRLIADPMGVIQQAFFDFHIMPVPKERPRVVKDKVTGKVRTFTPERTTAFHKDVHLVVDSVMGDRQLMSGPLHIDMTFKMPLPQSWPKWRKAAAIDGIIRPTGRPDMDNLEKALLDAFNDHLIADDSLVVERFAKKIYAISPGIEVRIDRLLAGDIHISRAMAETIRKISGVCEQ